MIQNVVCIRFILYLDEELDVFWKLYYKAVFINKKPEYLTERQDRINGGPLLVDIDMNLKRVLQLENLM